MNDSRRPGSPADRKLFGTFSGVFTPTLLTILGVIMYLRLPWTVGNAGLLGGIIIILLVNGITAATGLSLSSIATNTRMGAGGPYAIISRSLGFEIGGSIGVPLYLSQALAVAMYIFGFREGWLWIFPTHPPLLVDLAIFAVILVIAYLSASLAFKIQYGVMVVIAVSLVLVFGNLDVWGHAGVTPTLWGSYPGSPENHFSGTNFWVVFAVFFPAATGIMAGANMSGELRDPRRAIPYGTLSAIALSLVIYVALAFWVARAATPKDLVSNYTILLDRSLWGPGVLAGLLGATFSSALSSLVGAPRILAALARDKIIPRGQWLAEVSGGEPRRAMLVTGGIVLAGLLLRHLNVIAPLISMIFLITYMVINVVLLAESSLGLISFRPTFRLPRLIPLAGALGCLFTMFIINATFSLVAVGVVVGIYFWIVWNGATPRAGTVRSGIFVAFAEWAANKVIELDMGARRAWKPSVLMPVEDPATIRGEFSLLVDLCGKEGSLKFLGLATRDTVADLQPRFQRLCASFQKTGVMATSSIVDSAGFAQGTLTGLQALGSAFFRPNILLLNLPRDTARHEEFRELVREARRLEIGVLLVAMHEKAGLGMAKVVNVWVPPREPATPMADYLQANNLNLGLLMAIRLAKAWRAELNIISVVPHQEDVAQAGAHIDELRDLCRIENDATTRVMVGDFQTCVGHAPQSDMDILGLKRGPDLQFVDDMVRATRSSCMFVADSGLESALA
jgi:solute carrier family 12 sodium/potassium/chloride transporter 2